MEIQVPFSGAVALQLIIQNTAPVIAKCWDGSTQLVAFVFEKPPNQLEVRFAPNRATAIGNLRRIALTLAPPVDGYARNVANDWGSAPRGQGLECVIVGWGNCQLLELDPDDLKAMRDQSTTGAAYNEYAARVVLLSQTREGALGLVRELRATMIANGGDQLELEALQRALETSWDDAVSLSMAASRAAAAIKPTTGTVSQTTTVHVALTLMADAFGNRAAAVTGTGGDA
jgi:hypothetical protein